MFRITWYSLTTGASGHGEKFTKTEQEAREIADKLNKKIPYIKHTIEKESLTLDLKGHRCSYGDLTFVAHASPSPSPAATPITMSSQEPSVS
uniref:Uncharacterized protein n=1 Tax=viral metagenome TaxID=1070528 RepID=A0A6C0AN60_9ZZZZ